MGFYQRATGCDQRRNRADVRLIPEERLRKRDDRSVFDQHSAPGSDASVVRVIVADHGKICLVRAFRSGIIDLPGLHIVVELFGAVFEAESEIGVAIGLPVKGEIISAPSVDIDVIDRAVVDLAEAGVEHFVARSQAFFAVQEGNGFAECKGVAQREGKDIDLRKRDWARLRRGATHQQAEHKEKGDPNHFPK